jgi:Peptidase family S51
VTKKRKTNSEYGNNMTTYILAGGNDRGNPSYGPALAREIRKVLSGDISILSCLFAIPREDWERTFPEREQWLRQTLGENVSVTMALPGSFTEQVLASDVVYIYGGDNALLSYYLGNNEGLPMLLQDKVVVGSSAGANFLSAHFWTCDWRETRKGSGLTSLNVIPHYKSETYGKNDPRGPINWRRAAQELGEFVGGEAMVTLLREGEFVVANA